MAIDWDRAVEVATGESLTVITISDEETVDVSAGKEILYIRNVEGEGGGGGDSVEWGDIGGVLNNQTDLRNALNAKANTADLGDLATQDTVDYTTEVTNKPTLGALASKDTADYATDLTNKPTLGALAGMDSISYSSNYLTDKPTLGTMSAVNDAASDSKTYGRKNGQWVEVTGGGGGSTDWGDIGGTLSDQTDLQNALDAKQDELTFDTTPTTGSTNPVTSGGLASEFSAYAQTIVKRVLYYPGEAVSAATSAQIMRIPASGTDSKIGVGTIVLDINFADPGNITSAISWESFAGYIIFTGTCTAATTANVVLGTKGN